MIRPLRRARTARTLYLRPARVGYVPGAWDMFHIGHLRMIKRARELCDYLIVGVVTDEALYAAKQKLPVVPLEERMEVVGSIAGVDRVVVDTGSDKRIAWEQLRFEVLFKGDDWKGQPKGDRLELDMASRGVEVHYLPYTGTTSSTLLRKKLLDIG